MKLSLAWLREWVDPPITLQQLVHQLTMAGLEAEQLLPVAGLCDGVVVGEIVASQPHPQQAAWQVVQVDVGWAAPLQIVCDAPNCRVGMKVVCAPVGATLPQQPVVQPAEWAGVDSAGCLCTEALLEILCPLLGDQELITLPVEAPVGVAIKDYLQLDDRILDLQLTPNRADCLSLLGVAREVAVLNQLPCPLPPMASISEQIGDQVCVVVQEPQACPRYLGRVIKDLRRCCMTPYWMQEKLRRSGFTVTQLAIVDITNYVQLELGQPLHPFALQAVADGVTVRLARSGESITLLHDKQVVLQSDTLLVTAGEQPLALAGIMGGAAARVEEETEALFLECAYFHPVAIAGRAQRYGLHSEAAYRFERGVDPTLQERALARATQLLLAICGGKAGPVVESTAAYCLPKRPPLFLRQQRVNSLIGQAIDTTEVTSQLTALGCQVQVQEAGWQVVAPPWRVDLNLEVDLIEEIARLYGYSQLPQQTLYGQLLLPSHPETVLPLRRVRTLLVARGYQEAITYSFVDPQQQQWLHPLQPAVEISNPISRRLSVLRLSLWSGLLAAVAYNHHHQQQRVRLFETGIRFSADPTAEQGIAQEMVIAGVVSGSRHLPHWDTPSHAVDFFDLKGDVEAILNLTGFAEQFTFKKAHHPALHPGQSAVIVYNGEQMGWIGTLHPTSQQQFGLTTHAVVFELLWEPLLRCRVPQWTAIVKFPVCERDISIVISEQFTADDVINFCKKVAKRWLIGIHLFDLYRGKGIPQGYKSLSIKLLLQSATHTVEEVEIAAVVSNIVVSLQQKFQASLRN